jgi:thiamine-phosphate pyrophosphorylase
MKRCAITDGSLPTGGHGPELDRLAARCTALAEDGVDFLILREKQLTPREFYLATRSVLEAVQDFRITILVAGPTQVALAANADGVHVGTDYARVRQVKREFAESWVSLSCHSVEDMRIAREAGADLCLFGPVFGKTVAGVEVVPAIGLEVLREACAAAGPHLPVFALGGVTAANASSCVEAGAAGVAGIRMFFSGEFAPETDLPR